MCLLRFQVVAEHVPRKQLAVADVLSRNPLSSTSDSSTDKDKSHQPHTEGLAAQAVTTHSSLHAYYTARSQLSEADGLILYQDRLVIPAVRRSDVLKRIHEGHQGLTKCRARARMSVWWPRISSDITQLVTTCRFCMENKPSQRHEPLLTTLLAEGPWQRIAADLFEFEKQNYLFVKDYYSRDIEIGHLSSTSSRQITGRLKSIFVRWGIPLELVTDNGTQFTSDEFKQFCAEYGFTNIHSSPHFPQANGAAEHAVQTAKHILKQPDPHLALMCYRATPSTATGVSPVKVMTARHIKTTLPMLVAKMQSEPLSIQSILQKDTQITCSYKFFHDQHHSARPLTELLPGQNVRVKLDGEKAWKGSAKVLNKCDEQRSYLVKMDNGTVSRRNRRHLQLVPDPTEPRELAPEASPEKQPSSPLRITSDQNVLDTGQSEETVQQPQLSTPCKAVQMTSRGRVIRVPQRFRE